MVLLEALKDTREEERKGKGKKRQTLEEYVMEEEEEECRSLQPGVRPNISFLFLSIAFPPTLAPTRVLEMAPDVLPNSFLAYPNSSIPASAPKIERKVSMS